MDMCGEMLIVLGSTLDMVLKYICQRFVKARHEKNVREITR